MIPESALDELRRNNTDLIAAVEDATRPKELLLLLNELTRERLAFTVRQVRVAR